MDTKLYEILTSMHGGSGAEAEVREFMEKHLENIKRKQLSVLLNVNFNVCLQWQQELEKL